MAWLAVVLIVFLIIVASCIADLVHKAKNSFPEERGERPAGSSEPAVNAAVFDKLQSCAQSAVLKPRNCPQGTGSLQAKSVRWLIHGNPIDGVQFAWHDDRFYVRGNAVMTVSYLDYIGTQKLETHVVPFQAEVEWSNGDATVPSIYAVAPISEGDVQKRKIIASEEQVRAVLRDTFHKCAASTVSPMPSVCPNSFTTPRIDDAVWKFEGDPTLNISQNFEELSGILHVVGSFAATVDSVDYRRESIFPSQPQVLSGDYDALLIKDGNALRVLQIQPMP